MRWKKQSKPSVRDLKTQECRERVALQGHKVEGYSRAVITQVSEARIEGYDIQAPERQGKRVRIQGIR